MVRSYTDPGTYISEIFKPRAAITPTIGLNLVVVSEGKKTKTIKNEVVVRGMIYAEALTVAGASPHTATLVNTSNNKQEDAILYRNGVELPDEAWEFSLATQITVEDAYYTSGATYTLDYVAINIPRDELENDPVSISKIGLFADSINYKENRDFEFDAPNYVDWNIATQAQFTSPRHGFDGAAAEFYPSASKGTFGISLNGKPTVNIDLSASIVEAGLDITAEVLTTAAVGPGSVGPYTALTAHTFVTPGSVVITTTKNVGGATMTVTDDGNGNLVGDVDTSVSNTIDYESGYVVLTFVAIPTFAANIIADYSYYNTNSTLLAIPEGTFVQDGVTDRYTKAALAHLPLVPGTFILTGVDAGPPNLIVTDDGNGNLVGDVDPAGTNTINYTTGAVDVTFSGALAGPGVGNPTCVYSYYTVGNGTAGPYTLVTLDTAGAGRDNIVFGSFSLSVDTGTTILTVVDDGDGNLTGNIDTSYAGNTIDYAAAATNIDVKFDRVIPVGSIFYMSYSWLTTAPTATNVRDAINNALAVAVGYGASYNSVASIYNPIGTDYYVRLTAPTFVDGTYRGYNSNIVLTSDYTGYDDILFAVFMVESTESPYEIRGVGKIPTDGQSYYVTYDMERPDEDYNTLKTFYTDSDFFDDIGSQEETNPLAMMGAIAWEEPIEKLYVVQVKDADDDDVYTDNDFLAALAILEDHREVTDVTCSRSTPVIRAALVQLLETECSGVKNNFKAIWVGAPRDTVVGDMSTANSLIYIARKELRPLSTSVARGRIVFTAPPNWTRSFIDSNGATQTAEVDSCYASVMLAARTCSFERASDTLFRKKFTQMAVESNYADSIRRALSANGVNVMVQEGGSVLAFDCLTTDASGDARYEEPSARTQKDVLAFDIIENINTQLLGIVPDSPADFVAAIKTVVGGVILVRIDKGDIGHYTESDGETVRDIDYTQDIEAYKDSVDSRTYRFKYYFNNRYPFKRGYGEFSVDVPFTVAI